MRHPKLQRLAVHIILPILIKKTPYGEMVVTNIHLHCFSFLLYKYILQSSHCILLMLCAIWIRPPSTFIIILKKIYADPVQKYSTCFLCRFAWLSIYQQKTLSVCFYSDTSYTIQIPKAVDVRCGAQVFSTCNFLSDEWTKIIKIPIKLQLMI